MTLKQRLIDSAIEHKPDTSRQTDLLGIAGMREHHEQLRGYAVRRYIASCTCGWSSSQRQTVAVAASDLQNHFQVWGSAKDETPAVAITKLVITQYHLDSSFSISIEGTGKLPPDIPGALKALFERSDS